MSTTRKLQTTLTKVEPTKVLYFASMPCENQCAEIRNDTVASMAQEDVPTVAFQYLKAGFLEKYANIELVVPILSSAYLIYQAVKNYDPSRLLGLVINIAVMLPPIANSRRHCETKNACDEWLQERLDSVDVDAIKQLSFSKQGMFKLADIMDENGIDSRALRRDADASIFVSDVCCCLGKR